MSDYARIRTIVEVSEASDRSRPYIKEEMADTLTPDEARWQKLQVDITTAQTITVSNFGTITAVVLENLDTSNAVELEWYTQRGTQVAGDLAIANDNPDTITDSLTGSTFITNGGEVGGYVRIASAEDAANDGAHLIQAITTDLITCGTGETLTANAQDTTATLSFERRNKQRVGAGRMLVIDNIVPSGNLSVLAITAAVNVRLLVLGT